MFVHNPLASKAKSSPKALAASVLALLAGAVASGQNARADSQQYTIPVDCGNIERMCSPHPVAKNSSLVCPMFAWSHQAVAELKASCERSGLRELSIDTMSDQRFKAWLLVDYLDRTLPKSVDNADPYSETGSWSDWNQPNRIRRVILRGSLNDDEMRGLLQLVSAAITPVANADAVRHRLNGLPFERMDLVARFVHLAYMNPKVGAEFLPQLYALALYDSSGGVRATASDFLSYADSNQEHIRALVKYQQKPASERMVFVGSPRAASGQPWTYIPSSSPQLKSWTNYNDNLDTFTRGRDIGSKGIYGDLEPVFSSDDQVRIP